MKRAALPLPSAAILQVSDRRCKRPRTRIWEWTEVAEAHKAAKTKTNDPPSARNVFIDHLAYPHIFEGILGCVIESQDASTLRALRSTCHSVRRRIDAIFLSDIEYRLSAAEPEGPHKLAPMAARPPMSRLLGLEWNGTPATVATIEAGPCLCHALWVAGEEDAERARDCPAHAHERRVREDALQLDYVRFVGDPHAHGADWAIGAHTEIHVVDMFPRRNNGWTRMNRHTLDSRRIALQAAAGCEVDTGSGPAHGDPVSAAQSGALGLSGVPEVPVSRTTKRRILNFRLHQHYEWLFDYCMLPPSSCTEQVVIVSPYTGPVQLEAPEDLCLMCSDASGCRTDPSKLIHVKPDPSLHLNPAEGPLFGLITSLADDWIQRLGPAVKTASPPPVRPENTGTITFVGAERWKKHWVQSRPSDVLLPDGAMREKIKMCFYWRCLSNVQDAILDCLTDEIDYTTRNPKIKRWWEFVYRFINEEQCFRFLAKEEYAEQAGERELELVLGEDV